VQGSRAVHFSAAQVHREGERAARLAASGGLLSRETTAAGPTLVLSLLPRHLSHALIGLIVLTVAMAGAAGSKTGRGNDLRGWTFEPFPVSGAPSFLATHPMLGPGLSERTTITEYIVQPGDSISEIANRLGVSTETVIWANDLSDPNLIRPGEVLRVPPVTGVLHTVQAGETLAQLAERYRVSVEAVLNYPLNRIEDPQQLIAGQLILFPFGVKPRPPAPASPVVAVAASAASSAGEAAAAAASTLRGLRLGWPTEGRITQYYSGYHPALDIAAPFGSGVFAIDGGTVVVAATGWNGGYGTMVDIDHGNGFVSRYAHLNHLYVRKGEVVTRGQPLGTVGLTGITTGPHVHFELLYRGVRINPLSYLR
jgi:murein DD-endopeptidase MepM/ murein hydrolase activator NlpD